MFRHGKGKGSFYYDTDAVEGFFSEIPAFVVVTIALTAFMINAVGAYSLHAGAMESEEKIDKARSVAQGFMAYDAVLIDGENARFWGPALDSITVEDIGRDLNMPHRYRIVITEYTGILGEDRVPGRSWLFGERPSGSSPAASVTRTVLVGWGDGANPIFLVAEMVVMVW